MDKLEPCYEKPSVVAARRLIDEGTPAIPSFIYSTGLRALFIAGGIWLAKKYNISHPLALGLSGALVVEAALLADESLERQRRGR